MSLTNEELLLLDNLIYSDAFSDIRNGDTVQRIIDKALSEIKNGHIPGAAEMSASEWTSILSAIKKDKVLCSYQFANYANDETGMRAACFVDRMDHPSDVNVVFRGTSGDYEWHDNGTGAYLTDTTQQIRAAEYINTLPASYGKNITVTGHSKGGNKAQYVTITTDRIGKCLSFDGQGFSPEFLDKYTSEIREKKNRITSISASKDFVNCLLYPIAGTQIYIETEEQNNFKYYHKPNIILSEDGSLRNETEQAFLSQAINQYTTYIASNLTPLECRFTVDGLIAFLETGTGKESILQSLEAGGNALSHIDDFVFRQIAKNYGINTELVVSFCSALAFPLLFLDDFLSASLQETVALYQKMFLIGEKISEALRSLGNDISEFADLFTDTVRKYAGNIMAWYNKSYNAGYLYAVANPSIRVDTRKLRDYADRLAAVNRRIASLDRRLDSLYQKVDLPDLLPLIQADSLIGQSALLKRCIAYLNDTADEFENTERRILSQIL